MKNFKDLLNKNIFGNNINENEVIGFLFEQNVKNMFLKTEIKTMVKEIPIKTNLLQINDIKIILKKEKIIIFFPKPNFIISWYITWVENSNNRNTVNFFLNDLNIKNFTFRDFIINLKKKKITKIRLFLITKKVQKN